MKAYQNASKDNRKALYSEYYTIELRLRQIHNQEEQKLVGYLDAFYKRHPIEYDRHLIISHIISGECLLQSQGADAQDIRDPELKAQKLKEYQQEMQAFATFLKKRFFGESNFDEAEYPVSQAASVP